MITYKEVYERAINLFDDPNILRAYMSDKIKFQKIMYPFLVNGVSIITAPTGVCEALASCSAPKGQREEFSGNNSAVYSVSITPEEGADMCYYINGKIDDGAVYDKDQQQVTFSQVVKENDTCAIEWYSSGEFLGDLDKVAGNMPKTSLRERVIDLLARATVISWADKERNFLLDIRNLLTDTDFKLHSSASSLHSKIEWVNDLRQEIFNLQNKLDWDLRNQNRSYYGY